MLPAGFILPSCQNFESMHLHSFQLRSLIFTTGKFYHSKSCWLIMKSCSCLKVTRYKGTAMLDMDLHCRTWVFIALHLLNTLWGVSSSSPFSSTLNPVFPSPLFLLLPLLLPWPVSSLLSICSLFCGGSEYDHRRAQLIGGCGGFFPHPFGCS